MIHLLIATTNEGKIKELHNFLQDLPVQLVSLKEVGITYEVEETGTSYSENSQKKAVEYSKLSKMPTIADDGGLEIAALGGMPGVKSRRWLGYAATDDELITHMNKVAMELPDTNRNAKFVTVVSFALPNGKVWSKKGEISGIIAKKPNSNFLHGYPYRSFFYLPIVKKFYHEKDLTVQEMKEYNHRLLAVNRLIPVIRTILRLD